MQVFLDLPAGTEVYWELYDMQTYRDWVWYEDKSKWCIGAPYWYTDYMMKSKVLDEPATNISISFTLSELQILGLGTCTNSTFMLLVQIRPPTGGDYYVGWDTDGCQMDSSDDRFWPLVRLGVWYCPCPPPPPQPPPALSSRPVPSPPSPLFPPAFPTPSSSPPFHPTPTSLPSPVPPFPPSPRPPKTHSPTSTPPPPPYLATTSPSPSKSTKAPRIPRIPRIPKPPHHPKRPAKPTRPARPLHHHRLARSSPPPS
ncbi:hypothetical protein Vretifemale_3556 [Volvox reticuliferus]|nr:hypothetical protein Vretifemale_3556 [Volvox reticuliferus]